MAAKEYFSLQKQEHKKGCCDRGSGFCACMLFLLIALLIAALVTAFVFLIMWVADHKSVVDTSCGQVEGTFCPHANAYIFRGIPYAAPPVEDLRWQAAVGLKKGEEDGAGPAGGECWEGVLEAKEKKDTCVRIDRNAENTTVIGSEDCLYLNVFTPSIDDYTKEENSTKKPVMVFIHGERGADDKYQPGAKMAADMGIVVVTLQYRLGAMGFLVLGDDDGNYGLTDQIEALKWVKDNIASFGGNPDNVTLIGQGSGSTCVLTLVASPEAKGLFHRAWAMSGAGLPSTPKGDSALEKDNSFVLTETECADIECLRNVTAEEVTKLVEAKWAEEDLYNLPSPHSLPYARIIVDGKILTEKLSDALGDLTGSDIPLIIGTAAQSVDADPTLGMAIKSMTTAEFLDYFNNHITEKAEDILPMYNFSSSRDPEYKLTTLITDARFACGQDKMATKAVVAFSSPVMRYRVIHAPSSEVNAFGSSFPAKYAFMGWDLYAFLGKVGEDMPVAPTEADTKFQDKIRLIAENFILNSYELPKYDGAAVLVSDRLVLEDKDKRDEVCHFWNDNYFQYRAMF